MESVRRITYAAGGVDHLLLVKTVADTEYVAALKWDESPGVTSVEALLRGHLGKSIRAIGELELWLRSRCRPVRDSQGLLARRA